MVAEISATYLKLSLASSGSSSIVSDMIRYERKNVVSNPTVAENFPNERGRKREEERKRVEWCVWLLQCTASIAEILTLKD